MNNPKEPMKMDEWIATADPDGPSPLIQYLRDPDGPSPLRNPIAESLREFNATSKVNGTRHAMNIQEAVEVEVPCAGNYGAQAVGDGVTVWATDCRIGGLGVRVELVHEIPIMPPQIVRLAGYAKRPQFLILNSIPAEPITFACDSEDRIVQVHDSAGVHDVVIQRGLL
jgi:hypothetical protein